MPNNKDAMINFRIKQREKEYLSFLAGASDLKLSELIREILNERVIKEKILINKKPN